MGPVNGAAFVAPFVLAVELDQHILLNRHSDGEIDVVSDQNGLSGWQSKNEALMPGAIIVVGKQANDGAFRRDHHAAAMIAECIFGGSRSNDSPTKNEERNGKQGNGGSSLEHCPSIGKGRDGEIKIAVGAVYDRAQSCKRIWRA